MTCRQLLALDPHITPSEPVRRDLDRLKRQLLRQRSVQLRYVRIIERLCRGNEECRMKNEE